MLFSLLALKFDPISDIMSKGEKKRIKRRLTGSKITSVLSISLVLLLVGVASALVLNARRVSDYFKENIRLSLICVPAVNDSSALALASSLDSLPYVKETAVTGREQGERELREMLGEDFLSVFETAPVPVSIDVSLKAEYVSADSIAKIVPLLQALPQIEEVESRQSLVETLNRNLGGISAVLGVFILLLLLISFMLIGNTVRLGLHARRFTIHTMQVVGASRAFIRRPFMRDAIVQGLISALLACGMLAGALFLLERSFPQIAGLFDHRMLCYVGGTVVVSGVLICVIATWITFNTLALSSEDNIYYE